MGQGVLLERRQVPLFDGVTHHLPLRLRAEIPGRLNGESNSEFRLRRPTCEPINTACEA